jgi:putative ABC transport system permease protein
LASFAAGEGGPVNAAPLTIRAIARMNLRRRPFRYWSLVSVVGLFAFTLFGGSILNANLREGLANLSGRMGADILIVPHGYEKKLQAAILRGEPSQFYIKADIADKIRSEHYIAAASPQLFLVSLDAGCCTAKVQLVGIDQDTDFGVRPWIRRKLNRPLRDDEVVAGSMIVPKESERVLLFGKPYTVAAKMDRTGMGFDTSVFMTIDAAHSLAREAKLVTGDPDAAREYVSSVMVKAREGFSVKEAANALMRKYALDYNLDMVVAADMLSSIAAGMKNLSLVLSGLACALWLVGLSILFVVFSAGQSERKRELGILRILGATRSKLAALILAESAHVSLRGAVTGILLAGAVVFPFNTLIFASLELPFMHISVPEAAGYAVLAFAAAVAVGPLACLWSVFSITRFDAYATLKEGE